MVEETNDGFDDLDLNADEEEFFGDVQRAEERLLFELQGNTKNNLLRVALEKRLSGEIDNMSLSEDIRSLLVASEWVYDDPQMTDVDLKKFIVAYIEGIAGMFIYNHWPIEDSWVTICDKLDIPEHVFALPLEQQAAGLIRYAEMRGVPRHLQLGMIEYFALDVSANCVQ